MTSKKKQCAGSFDKWLEALREGLLPHSHGSLATHDHLFWYDSNFSSLEGQALETLRRGDDKFRVGRVIYTYEVPVAIELVTDDDETAWLVNTRKYSKTSGKHRNFVGRVLHSLVGSDVMPLEAFVAGAQLPIECRDTFMALLPEWHGSYDDLASAVVALS